MQTRTLTLYAPKDSKIGGAMFNKSNNWSLDGEYRGMNDYLKWYAREIITIPNMQYFKELGLNLTLKLQLNENYVLPSASPALTGRTYNEIRYAKIEIKEEFNDTIKSPLFYFVDSITWCSENCVMLHMTMDTLNTFTEWQNRDYYASGTTIIREHKNRYKRNYHNGRKYAAFIDRESEQFQPVLYNTKNEKINDEKDVSNNNWFIIYKSKSTNENEPIEIYVTPENPISVISSQNQDIEISLNKWPVDNTYETLLTFGGVDVEITNTQDEKITRHYDYSDFWGPLNINLYRSSDYIRLRVYSLSGNTSHTKDSMLIKSIRFISIGERSFNISQGYYDGAYMAYPKEGSNVKEIKLSPSGTKTTVNLTGYNKIIKTDPTLNKIILCPYCPIPISIDENKIIQIPQGWSIDNNEQSLGTLLKYTGSGSVNFENKIQTSAVFDSIIVDLPPLDTRKTTAADIKYEPKMLNSAYSYNSLQYDSFSIMEKREHLDPNEINYNSLEDIGTYNIVMRSSNVLNSRFLFSIENLSNGKTIYRDNPYENIMIVSRNNEMPIYNSAYLNYIKNGYNYDVKSKERSYLKTAIGVAATVATGVVSLAAAPMAPLVLSTAALTLQSAINITQNEANMRQKQEELKSQNVTVSNSDDVSLMRSYNDNRLIKSTYECSETMKKVLFSLFYKFGYACNNIEEKPIFNSRYWFNYVQCNANFEGGKLGYNISDEIIEDIKSKLAAGVTVFHNHVTSSSKQPDWDFSYTKENWENFLLNQE